MSTHTYHISGTIWRYPGHAAWYFLTLDPETSGAIRAVGRKGGFGSVKIRATLGTTTWETSLFPEHKEGCYFMPVKASVRKQEGLADGATVTLTITLI